VSTLRRARFKLPCCPPSQCLGITTRGCSHYYGEPGHFLLPSFGHCLDVALTRVCLYPDLRCSRLSTSELAGVFFGSLCLLFASVLSPLFVLTASLVPVLGSGGRQVKLSTVRQRRAPKSCNTTRAALGTTSIVLDCQDSTEQLSAEPAPPIYPALQPKYEERWMACHDY
jgi:hypothetical protein